MWRRVLITIAATLIAAAFVAPAADAQNKPGKPEKSESNKPRIRTETLILTKGESKFSCYLARPAGDETVPGVLLVHEWWGLNDWVKAQADRFAENGYAAMALDLYHGEVAKDAEHAHELMRGLSDERALDDLKFAFEFLSNHKFTRGKPTGVIGWCMGGGYALKLAIAEPRVACSVVCYGKPVTDVDQLRKIKGPLLGIWGANDRGIEVEPFKKALEQAKVNATHKIFPGAGHAFLNETNERGYNKEQAEKAWAEIDRYLERHLKSAR